MSIEIKELVIRATVDPKGEKKKPAGEKPERSSREIVDQCVEQVMEILRKKGER